MGDLLAAVGVDPHELRDLAETLLFRAHGRDPLARWLPLLRHADAGAWLDLRGPALTALWQRVGAEVLLRAHEDLAGDGAVPPPPGLAGAKSWHPLHGRIAGPALDAEPLEAVLSRFGLAPHPRVLLLVEGETELLHLPRLFDLLGGATPDLVRVQSLGGAGVNAQLLARYAVSPRVGRRRADGWELAAPPTALLVAVDPDRPWETAEKRAEGEKKIKQAIRKDVERQGASIQDDVLDLLVRVEVWGDWSYELANFTDDELVEALTPLAQNKGVAGAGTPEREAQLRADLRRARDDRKDVGVVIGPLRVRKVVLAEVLWPVLERKCEAEVASGTTVTPVVRVAKQAVDLAAKIPRGNVLLAPPAPPP